MKSLCGAVAAAVRRGYRRGGVVRWSGSAAAVRDDVPRIRISKLLVANRGEIACRVMRTARRLGIRTVAVYSDVDRDAMHVRAADEAYHIGPAAATQSYLSAERLLEVARESGADAVHPGYGFLSESLEFCTRCSEEGVVFVGPPPNAIRDMGIKSTSKAIMGAAGVPIVEGYHGEDQSPERLRDEAHRIGFPLMIKAVRGGGGKGMRIARTEAEFPEALDSARRESLKAFGDENVLLERYVAEPRHVEVQVFADRHGNAVHLFERDCSVQRRHQKIIEEAPAPGLSEETRAALGEAAVRAAHAVGYEGAGTVEFILDRHTHSFHFCEMNTRLQVEHPITEMITGTDLVEWQLLVASGEPLPLTQKQILRNGHAVECRIYAEEPRADFLPRAGTLHRLRQPPVHDPHVRVESGVREGDDVSVHYDPMIAKLVVWAPNRNQALTRMRAQLSLYQVCGVESNIEFLMKLCEAVPFIRGDVHTHFIAEHKNALLPKQSLPRTVALRAALALMLWKEETHGVEHSRRVSLAPAAFRPNYRFARNLSFYFNGDEFKVQVERSSTGWRARLGDETTWSNVDAQLELAGPDDLVLRATVDRHTTTAPVAIVQDKLYMFEPEGVRCVETAKGKRRRTAMGSRGGAGGEDGASPTPGVLERLLVNEGDQVEAGQPLFVVIAMKMEYTVRATHAGRVENIAKELVGTSVRRGQRIVTVENDKS